MELNNDNMIKLIANLEYEIGSECYNANSYNGWTGEEGCSFRYPLKVPTSSGESKGVKIYNKFTDLSSCIDISPNLVSQMYYQFGSNELMICQGIINALGYIENRYGISFNELEEKLKQDKQDR